MDNHRTALLRFAVLALAAALAASWFGLAARHLGDPQLAARAEMRR